VVGHLPDKWIVREDGDSKRPGSCAGVLSLAGVSAWWRYDDYDKTGEDRSHWNKSGLSRYVVGEDDVFITVV
jgi:hypothetical protein